MSLTTSLAPCANNEYNVSLSTDLGFSFKEQFTDETAAALVISDNIYAMLLSEEKFKTFTKKEI
jgi:predicted lactoylglutathione lyase